MKQATIIPDSFYFARGIGVWVGNNGYLEEEF